jgi:hypothetical protein
LKMASDDLDLAVIDRGYGPFADLYSDVLRVNGAASDAQIQLAYFDRRAELFAVLAKLKVGSDDERGEWLQTERMMDAVVLAVRILGDPALRDVYDRTRDDRLVHRRRVKQGLPPGQEAQVRDASDSEITTNDTEAQNRPQWGGIQLSERKKLPVDNKENNLNDAPAVIASPSRSKKEKKSLKVQETREISESRRQGGGDVEKHRKAERHAAKEGYMSWITQSRTIRRFSDEIGGACEDAMMSVDQVFNAFTLTEKDIRAVTKRIDRAKREMDY